MDYVLWKTSVDELVIERVVIYLVHMELQVRIKMEMCVANMYFEYKLRFRHNCARVEIDIDEVEVMSRFVIMRDMPKCVYDKKT